MQRPDTLWTVIHSSRCGSGSPDLDWGFPKGKVYDQVPAVHACHDGLFRPLVAAEEAQAVFDHAQKSSNQIRIT